MCFQPSSGNSAHLNQCKYFFGTSAASDCETNCSTKCYQYQISTVLTTQLATGSSQIQLVQNPFLCAKVNCSQPLGYLPHTQQCASCPLNNQADQVTGICDCPSSAMYNGALRRCVFLNESSCQSKCAKSCKQVNTDDGFQDYICADDNLWLIVFPIVGTVLIILVIIFTIYTLRMKKNNGVRVKLCGCMKNNSQISQKSAFMLSQVAHPGQNVQRDAIIDINQSVLLSDQVNSQQENNINPIAVTLLNGQKLVVNGNKREEMVNYQTVFAPACQGLEK